MKFVRMRGIQQRWRTLTSRAFQLFYKDEGGRGRVLNLVKIRGVLYPVGKEPDPEECQLRDWEVRPFPEEVEPTI